MDRDDLDERQRETLARAMRRIQGDPELARSAPSPAALQQIARGATSIACLAAVCEAYGPRPCFGRRAEEVDPGAVGGRRLLPCMRYVTYDEVWSRVQAVASGLSRMGLAGAGSFVGICAFASPDWAVVDLACLYLAAVSVPLATTASPADLAAILGETELGCFACGLDQVELVASVLPACPTVRSVVLVDARSGDAASAERTAAATRSLRRARGDLGVATLEDVEHEGRAGGAVPWTEPSARAGGGDPLMTLMYTSGSTGTPKGAMYPETLWREQWRAPAWAERHEHVPHVAVNYMPMNHAAGRFGLVTAMVLGGVTCFVARSDLSTLFDDIRIARPTALMLVPRVATILYQRFQAEVIARAAASPGADEAAIAAEVEREMGAEALGDRLVVVTTGTAPTPPEIAAFLRRCFDVLLVDGYGSTEAGPIGFDGRIADAYVSAWKLVDVPELGYRATDRPHPRGELRIRTRRAVPGYWRNPEATRELFDEDGFVKTGDIVEMPAPGRFVWIDRRKNVLKLAQGEFVATSRLESAFAAGSPFIGQIYVHGTSDRSYLLAVVVPDDLALEARFGRPRSEIDPADIESLLRAELDRVAAAERLQAYEVPRAVLVAEEPFTRENGLLTDSSKPSRPKLRARYGGALDALYAAIERRRVEELGKLARAPRGRVAPAEAVSAAIEATLGLSGIDARGGRTFEQLGGDSLAAVELSTAIEGITGVVVPVSLVLARTTAVRDLTAFVEGHLEGTRARRPTFAEIHGENASVLRAEDLRLERFLGDDDRAEAARAEPASALPREAERVLLTGASGFLGKFLLIDLLERLPARGRVHAVVRAASDDAALARLAAAYDGDARLRARFDALTAGGRLRVLAGDLVAPDLGLSAEAWDALARDVDTIVHAGALVNHALPYAALFEPNVLGTVELARLALRRRIKAIAYVSTVGVASAAPHDGPVREDEDARALGTERPVASGYAAGYGASKWASELLLGELAERFGVPVDVFRCSMILPHRAYRAELNATDMVSRLLVGVIDTGLAPRSFYAGPGPHHFDGTPVDVVAAEIDRVAIDRRPEHGALASPRLATWHVVNGAGTSLDAFVDWVASAGWPLERIDDHARWFQAFRARLEALPSERRQRSPLAILDHWARPIARELAFDRSRLAERLRRAGAPDDEVTPAAVDERYVHAYLDDLVALGLASPPEVAPPASERRPVGAPVARRGAGTG